MLEVVLEVDEGADILDLVKGFNPYFAGSSSGRYCNIMCDRKLDTVSILILLEVVLEEYYQRASGATNVVSILILLEVVLEAAGAIETAC